MNLFDILGPVMVGPSSSHTAGAVRIGYIGRVLLKDRPLKAEIILHGSFATTGRGHGTDRALIAGILGMKPDDNRIPDSFGLATERGLEFVFHTSDIKGAHPNTACLQLTGETGACISLQASSVGGGRISVDKLDGIEVGFSPEKPTLIVYHVDMPGHVAKIASMLYQRKVNIAAMQLYRAKKGGQAVMVMELDQPITEEAVAWVEQQAGIVKVTYINTEELGYV